jgi:acetyltransferase-like isoleucine patch superfamily enzyme
MSIINRLYNAYLHKTNTVKWARRIGVKVGEHTMIAKTVVFPSEPYLITIGNNVQLTKFVTIHTHGGGHVLRKMNPDFDCFGKVCIEDWAYIGAGSIILPGVTIGEGALVAAGSVVTKSVKPHTVVGGNPAKLICTTEEYAIHNEKYNINTKGLSASQKRKKLMGLDDSLFIRK